MKAAASPCGERTTAAAAAAAASFLDAAGPSAGSKRKRRSRGGQKRRPKVAVASAAEKFTVAWVIEELVRDVCAAAELLPAPLWPCDDHRPCDEDDECGGCGCCDFTDGILTCEECARLRHLQLDPKCMLARRNCSRR